jgi:hypothetical protein
VSASGIDLDDLFRDNLANGVIAINKTQGAQRERKGPVEPLYVFRFDLSVLRSRLIGMALPVILMRTYHKEVGRGWETTGLKQSFLRPRSTAV